MAKVIGEFKVSISQENAGVAGKLADPDARIDLDQCKECGVWVSEDEELYGDGYCSCCGQICCDCDLYFNSKDMLPLSINGDYRCQQCNDKNKDKEEGGCPQCGCSSFYAHQVCRVDIMVDSDNNFLENIIPDNELGASVYDSETPYGPYQCIECGKEYEELPK